MLVNSSKFSKQDANMGLLISEPNKWCVDGYVCADLQAKHITS